MNGKFKVLLFLFASFAFCMNGSAQSVGFAFGYSPEVNKSDIDLSFYDYYYKKSPEYSLAFSLSPKNEKLGEVAIRLTSYKTELDYMFFNFNSTPLEEGAVSHRKYILELQYYFLSYKIFNNLRISLGSKFSYILRSSLEESHFMNGVPVSSSNNIPIESGQSLYAHILGKISGVSFPIDDTFSIEPSYSYAFSFKNDTPYYFFNSRLRNHLFELKLIRKLSDKKRGK